jgi:hypothetical protein
MTDERAISDHIIDTYITSGRLFTDATFVQVAMQAFLEKYRVSDSPSQFQCSPGFTSDLKRRNRFSSRRSHLKPRPTVSDDDRIHWMTLAQLRQEAMKKDAEDLGIHLLFIPAGLTDETQPLERVVFRGMKAHGRQMYRNHAMSVEPIGKQVAEAFLVRAWDSASTAVLDEAWALSEEFEEHEE